MLSRRLYHTFEARTLQQYLKDPIKLLVIPIRNNKQFLYYKHGDDLLNQRSWLIKSEKWTVDKSLKLWEKLKVSEKSYNKKIVLYINKLLDTVSWTEDSLASVPNESALLKRLKDSDNRITLAEYNKNTALDKKHLLPLHIYYPIQQEDNTSKLVDSLKRLSNHGLVYHKRQMLYCLLGLPLTIPLILLPLIPNVPGFYLTYRIYRNYKAYLGAKHLAKIVDEESSELSFFNLQTVMDKPLLTEEQLPIILDQLEVQELEPKLLKAIRQENAKAKQ